MMGLPPWLSVNPGDFVRAAQAGSALGLQVAQAQNRADEAQREQEFRRWSLEQELRQRATELAARREEAARRFGQEQAYNLERLSAQQAHYGAMEARAKALAEGKQYGEPVINDIPGVPGAKYAYRPGSPGLHVINPPTQRSIPLTIGERTLAQDQAKTAVEEEKALGAQVKEMSPTMKKYYWFDPFHTQEMIPNPAYSDATNRLAQLQANIRSIGGRKPVVESPAAATPSPFKEGALIRNKKDGKTYRVQNGTPVPVEEPATVADTEGTEDENAD